jgi:cytoskeleton protein RodZ
MPDIGSTLREARMRDRIDISEVEAQTKIRAKYLRAIENEEWDLLPGPVYAKSFLRTYGDYLGLDSRMLVDEFRRRYEGPADHDFRPVASRPPRERDRHPGPRRAPSWLPIAIVVVLVVVALGIIGSLNTSNNSTTTSQRAPAHRPARHHAATTAVKPPAVPTKVTLHLVPTNLVYVCLVDGVGTKLINEQTFATGETIPTETASKLLLTLGNNNVQMRVNGKLWPVAASPTAIRLMITPTGVRPIPTSQLPTCP